MRANGLLARLGPGVILAVAACVGTIGGADDEDTEGTTAAPAVMPAQALHRLNRLEYNNTVRDLLGTELRPADAFPPDGESDGFDNAASALQLTPTLLDGYFHAARTVIDDALDDRPAYALRFEGDALAVAGGYPVGDLWALSGQPLALSVTVPDGGATVTLLVGASQIGAAPAPLLAFEVDGVLLETFAVPGAAAALAPKAHAVALTAGAHTLRYVPTNFVNQPVENNSNNVLVRSVVVEADERIVGAGRELVFTCQPTGEPGDPCPMEVLTGFTRRAWRRPLTGPEVGALLALYTQLVEHGEPVEQAIRLVMRSVLTSPKFIYRARTTSDADDGEWLDDHTLASRLSYFLWSSMPDERLSETADRGELSSEEGLREAVTWMLADDKASGLSDGFAEQWLSTRLLAQASPSPEVYPGFDEQVRASMVAESKAFFADFLHNGLPVVALLRPDFAHLDDRLANHYGLEPVGSDTMTRVPAGQGDRRGLLALGSWLTSHSDAEHASPIRRGRWVSDRILCEPVPPPPAGLVIEPIEVGKDGLGLREALEQHRKNPDCATCHALLDVLGMGFEELDGVARVRDEPGLDTLGELPSGVTFEGVEAFVDVLDEQVFVTCVARKLFSYAAGRSVVDFDRKPLATLGARAASEGFTLPELIIAIVSTPAFRSPAPLDEDTP